MKWKALVVGVALALVTGMGMAQNTSNQTDGLNQSSAELDTVLVASSASHIDPTIADVVSERLGVPVVLAGPENLSDEEAEFFSGVDNAVIVGGPAALSENVEEQIRTETENTIRVWGETATDTSLEVSNYFWSEDNEQVNIVQTDLYDTIQSYRVLSALANDAENPVILEDENMSEEALTELEDQGVEEATVHTTDENITELENIFENNSIEASFENGSAEVLAARLHNETFENTEKDNLFATTGSNFNYGIPTYSSPSTVTFPVTRDSFEKDIQMINGSGFDTFNIIGEPELGQEITGEINQSRETSFIEVTDKVETSIDLVRNNSETWNDLINEDLVSELEFKNANETMEEANESGTTNETENETENESENMTVDTENESQEDTTNSESVASSIGLSSSGNTVAAEGSYSDGNSYSTSTRIFQNQTHIQFLFSLEPTENETSDTEYNFEQELQAEDGEYQTSVGVAVNGEVVEQTRENLTID
ncbi:cell wall-binding repeat-containing protein [Candidatus Nanohalobium constans]|uniref:Cell wall-binding repeat-containing protein n=1 Tax=Candidatus Nanohalobium constans TaxID=2565781 RepID=A0A5Q0UGB1_9ARCH|nr:hypothetical protein [Candidatus Nanohalobium constans]QGA80614.1 hypothetical protein LC1Nh_0727 [Candidatus Nanohalobium constans]